MNRIIPFCLCLLTIIFYSCEYPNDGNYFKEIEKPAPEHLFAIEMDTKSETILIAKPTLLKFKVNTFGLDLNYNYTNDGQRQGIRLSLDNKALDVEIVSSTQEHYYSTYINPSSFSEGTHTLTLYVETTGSGSGSIADKIGAERYSATYSWQIQIENLEYNSVNMMPLQHKKNEDGCLQLNWNKPNVASLIGYRIIYSHNYIQKDTFITNIDNTFFVDREFTCGSTEYQAYAIVKDYNDEQYSYSNIKYRGAITVSEPLPSVKIEEINSENLKISWSSTYYKSRYVIRRGYNDDYIANGITDTSIIIPSPGIGFRQIYFFSVTPYDNPERRDNNQFVQFEYAKGTLISKDGTAYYAYNLKENKVFTSVYNDYIHAYTIPNFNKKEEKYVPELGYFPKYSCPTNDAKIAINVGQTFHILNTDMKSLFVFSNEKIYSYPFYLKMTNNNLIAVGRHFENEFFLFDASTGEVLLNTALDNMPAPTPTDRDWIGMDVSQDGKYVVSSNRLGMSLYAINNHSVQLLHQEKGIFYGALINPLQTNQLIVHTINGIEIREISSNKRLRLINSIKNPVLCNIDPASGYLLVSDLEYNYVFDLQTGYQKLKVKNKGYENKLYGNALFTDSGYAYDLNTLLNQ